MTNPLEYSTVPPEKLDTLIETTPEYSIQLDDNSEVVVTPEAHKFFGFTPLMPAVLGRLERERRTNTRIPYSRVVLTAPGELSDMSLAGKTVLFSTDAGENTYWMSRPETPDEYVAHGFKEICSLNRENYVSMTAMSDERILEGIDTKAAESEFRAGHLADMVNWLEPYVCNRTTIMREMSFPQNDQRKQLLVSEGIGTIIRLQETGLPMEGIQDITTLPQIARYGSKRAYEVCCKVFGAFCPEPFDLHRTSQGITG